MHNAEQTRCEGTCNHQRLLSHKFKFPTNHNLQPKELHADQLCAVLGDLLGCACAASTRQHNSSGLRNRKQTTNLPQPCGKATAAEIRTFLTLPLGLV